MALHRTSLLLLWSKRLRFIQGKKHAQGTEPENSIGLPLPNPIIHWTLDIISHAHGYFLATNLFTSLVLDWAHLPLPLFHPSSTPLLSLKRPGHTDGQSAPA